MEQVDQLVGGVREVAGRLHEPSLVLLLLGVDCTIQYARKPSPVNLSNQPPGVPIPPRTADTNLSMVRAKSSNLTASFISIVDSRMSAAITNIWIGSGR